MNRPLNPPPPVDDLSEAGLVSVVEGDIDVQVAAPYAGLTPASRLVAAVTAALASAGVAEGQVSLVIAGDDMLHDLNRDYRGVDAPTDVLSFAAREEDDDALFVSAPEAASYLGDVIIAYPTAARQAEAAGHAVDDELCLLAVHGALHLLGYDHATPAEEAAMWEVQAAVLASLGIAIDVPSQA